MTKLALCVGLNYPKTYAELNGCINDMQDWSAELAGRGYVVRQLAEPTKDELVTRLRELVASARYRDSIVVTYSGHGTWVPDRDGDEPDGRDEAWVCSDYARGGGLLLDDELYEILGARRHGVRALIVSDSCHSGSVNRFVDLDLRIAGAPRRRFLPPAAFMSGKDMGRAEIAAELPARAVGRKGAILLSGCSDVEYSYDALIDGRANGAFTRYALNALQAGSSLGAWHKATRTLLPSDQFPQTPQLDASTWQRYRPAL